LTSRSAAPAIVVSAIVHGELLALRPFGWGNGLVARAAGRLVLVSRGLDPKAVTAPEVGHAERAGDYAAAASAYVAGDVARWVRHCAEAVALGAQETLAICAALERSA
jgi:Fic family protein